MGKQAVFGENSKHDFWLTVWVAVNKVSDITTVAKGVEDKKEKDERIERGAYSEEGRRVTAYVCSLVHQRLLNTAEFMILV